MAEWQSMNDSESDKVTTVLDYMHVRVVELAGV